MEIPQAFQMAAEAPAKDQDSIRRPFLDLLHQPRVNDSIKMMCTRVGGSISDKAIIIAFQYRNVPFDMLPETRVKFGAVLRLFPCIKHLDQDLAAAGYEPEKRRMILNRMRRNNG